jgi:membrane protease YdiL (CAAX protease family)
MTLIRKIRESIITKWIVLYYTFFFILGSYLLLQLLFTTLQFFFFGDPTQSVTIQGFYVNINGVPHQIWDLPQFHIAMILSSIIILALVFLITKLTVKSNVLNSLGFVNIKRNDRNWFLYSLIMLLSGILLREYSGNTSEINISADNGMEMILIVLGLGIFGPLLEEVVYRGYLLSRMDHVLANKHRWVTVIITAAIFAAFHFQYNLFELVYIFAIGIFLAIMRFKTGSIWFPIIFHVVGNLYAVLTILL